MLYLQSAPKYNPNIDLVRLYLQHYLSIKITNQRTGTVPSSEHVPVLK